MNSDLSGIEHIGTRLRMVRIEKGLTQEQLAKRAGTTQEVVQSIENGRAFRPRESMELAEALNINPAWLEFGEPYASKARPAEMSKKLKVSDTPDFVALLRLADQLIRQATKGQIAETARLLALNLAHYQLRFGELPLANFNKLMDTQEMDDETARLVAVGMENLVGVLGLVSAQDDSANDQKH